MSKITNTRAAKESWVEMTEAVMPSHTNPAGNLFGGQVMAWVDLCAAICAIRHCRNPCVTASIDALHFLKPVYMGWLVILKASVNFTGTSSMEIGVRVESENPITAERHHTASAYLTMVALGKEGEKIQVPKIVPENDEEKERWIHAEERRKFRLIQRKKTQH